jgi:hypothetical protein
MINIVKKNLMSVAITTAIFGGVAQPAQHNEVLKSTVTNALAPNVTLETEKWAYVKNVFNRSTTTHGFGEEVGVFLKNNKEVITDVIGYGVIAPITAIATLCIFIHYHDKGFFDVFNVKNRDTNMLIGILLGTVFVSAGSLTVGIAGARLIKNLLAIIGESLSTSDVQCMQALKNFVGTWDKNREKTPQTLQPLFDGLAQDYQTHNGALKSITTVQAKKLVEALLLTATVMRSLNNK